MNKLYEFMPASRGKLLVESASNGKSMCMSGIFIQGDVRNQNQRVYPRSEINRAVDHITNRINNDETIMGELDHPEELSINLDRVSHIIESMWMSGNDGHGKLRITEETPMGNIACALLRSGAKLGVSSRGSGNVDHNGSVSDFEIVTVDIVATPSAPNAYPRAIYESLFNMRGGARVLEASRDFTSGHQTTATHKYIKQGILRLIDELGKQ